MLSYYRSSIIWLYAFAPVHLRKAHKLCRKAMAGRVVNAAHGNAIAKPCGDGASMPTLKLSILHLDLTFRPLRPHTFPSSILPIALGGLEHEQDPLRLLIAPLSSYELLITAAFQIYLL